MLLITSLSGSLPVPKDTNTVGLWFSFVAKLY